MLKFPKLTDNYGTKISEISAQQQRLAQTANLTSDSRIGFAQRQSTSASQVSKLKCSTITRVPSAKSRLNQAAPNLNELRNGQKAKLSQFKQPETSRLARPSSTSSVGVAARARPTSLALKSSANKRLSNIFGSSTSSTINIDNNSRAKTVSGCIPTLPKPLAATNLKLADGTQQQRSLAVATAKSNETQNGTVKRKFTRKLAGSKSASPLDSLGSGSSISISCSGLDPPPATNQRSSGLKNLVAIVHPQRSAAQRVNSSAPTTSSPVKNKSVCQTQRPSRFATSMRQAEGENGKVNSNNNGDNNKEAGKGCSSGGEKRLLEELRESKQDGGKLSASSIARHVKRAILPTTSISASNQPSPTSGHLNTLPSKSSLPSSTNAMKRAEITIARAEQSEDRQFVRNLNSRDSSQLSVASSANGNHDTKKQHPGNNKQSSSKHLYGHGLSTTNTSTTIKSDDDGNNGDGESKKQQAVNDNNNNCFNYDCSKSASTKSPALYFNQESKTSSSKSNESRCNSEAKIHQAISDRILPKPMGQQVLSLMMLDVGLLPASNHQQLQSSSPPRDSHVYIHNQILPSNSTHQDVFSGSQFGKTNFGYDGPSPICLRSNEEILLPNRMGERDNVASHDRDHEQSGSNHHFHSLQMQAHHHEMLRLQVHFSNQDTRCFKSISLPASPRMKAKIRTNQSATNRSSASRAVQFDSDIRQSSRKTLHLANHSANQSNSSNSVFSPNGLVGLQNSVDQNGLLQSCDNQDTYSLTSSSCSSLSHCPPLLALSNQLSNLKLDELVRDKTTAGLKTIENESHFINLSRINSGAIQTSNQVAQISKQHELLTNDLTRIEKPQLSAKIDCSQDGSEYTHHSQLYLEGNSDIQHTQVEYNEFKIAQALRNNNLLANEDCIDPQLRRQQQRSNSISGQDFHSNGSYQRLKQSVYCGQQANVHDGYQPQQQMYNSRQTATNNRLQQILTPYQSQQHHVARKSPSPNCVTYQSSYYDNTMQGDRLTVRNDAERQPRNQLHASLECLNSGSTEYQQTQHQQHYQQQQRHYHNQHYAASYVLAPPPANTIINQNGDQDLAAAAMGNAPPSQYHTITGLPGHPSQLIAGLYGNNQNPASRVSTQVPQSPLRRVGLNGVSSNGVSSSSVLNHITGLHQPIRAGHSSLSLASSSFIIEDKLQNEIKKLNSELRTEKEKNEALNSQLNINSSLMSAFEQSLTTLNTRLRQLTTLNEKKDNEIEELREQLRCSRHLTGLDENFEQINGESNVSSAEDCKKASTESESLDGSGKNHLKTIEELRRQLIEKDRLLTDTRLEALSAAHQLEQLESKMNGENSLLVNEDDLDEGVMVVNHSPSDSDAITDSAHFSEINSQISRSNQKCNEGDSSNCILANTIINSSNNGSNNNNNYDNGGNQNDCSSHDNNNTDDQSNHSSDYQIESKERDNDDGLSRSISQHFNDNDSGTMNKLMDNLLLTS